MKQSAKRGAWIAYQVLRKRGAISPKSEIARSGIAFDFVGDASIPIGGPSAGLCFLVRMAQALLEESLRYQSRPVPSYEFAATGILSSLTDNRVHRVEAITAKIKAALAVLPEGGIVFYPAENNPLSDPALSLKAKYTGIKLVGVDTPEEVLTLLLNHYGISARISEKAKPRWSNRWWLGAILGVGLVVMLVFLGWLWWTPGQPPSGSSLVVSHEPANPGPSKPAAPLSLGVKAALFYEGPEGSPLPLAEGKTLSQGDGFKIEVETDHDCYLYAFGIDSADQMEWLFPPERYLQPLPRGRRWIPGEYWFELDAVGGEEVIWVLATATPAESLEERRPFILNSKGLPIAERRALKAELVNFVERRRTENGDTLERLTFQHR